MFKIIAQGSPTRIQEMIQLEQRNEINLVTKKDLKVKCVHLTN